MIGQCTVTQCWLVFVDNNYKIKNSLLSTDWVSMTYLSNSRFASLKSSTCCWIACVMALVSPKFTAGICYNIHLKFIHDIEEIVHRIPLATFCECALKLSNLVQGILRKSHTCNIPVSQIPRCNKHISHNALYVTETCTHVICTILWHNGAFRYMGLVHCGLWDCEYGPFGLMWYFRKVLIIKFDNLVRTECLVRYLFLSCCQDNALFP